MNKRFYICSYDTCLGTHYARGLCRKHYDKYHYKIKQNKNNYPFIVKDNLTLNEILNSFIELLTHDEYQALKLRMIDNLTLIAVGKIMKKSRERVRQLEARALRRLRRSDLIKELK